MCVWEGSVCVSALGEFLFVVDVSLVCSLGPVDLCVVRCDGFMVGAPGRSCCVLVFCAILT